MQSRNQKVKVVTDTGTNKSSGSTTTATSKTTPTPTTPAPSSGSGGGGSSVWDISSEEEAEIYYNELLLQRDTLLNDITELYSRADAFNEEHAILAKRGLILTDRFYHRNINDIFIEVGNMAFGVPRYAIGDAEGLASAFESAYSFLV